MLMFLTVNGAHLKRTVPMKCLQRRKATSQALRCYIQWTYSTNQTHYLVITRKSAWDQALSQIYQNWQQENQVINTGKCHKQGLQSVSSSKHWKCDRSKEEQLSLVNTVFLRILWSHNSRCPVWIWNSWASICSAANLWTSIFPRICSRLFLRSYQTFTRSNTWKSITTNSQDFLHRFGNWPISNL